MSADWFSSLSVQDLWTLILVLYIAASVVVAALCAYVADEKGRSVWSWFFLGFFCGIFALIAIAGTPPWTGKKRHGIEDRLWAKLDTADRLKARAAEDEARRRSSLPPDWA
jgi:hypothetical protein